MNKQDHVIGSHITQLAKDARSLLAATADVAGDKVGEARKRLAAALESGEDLLDRAKEQALDGVKAADDTIRANPYQAIIVGVGVGALLGFLLANQCTGNRR